MGAPVTSALGVVATMLSTINSRNSLRTKESIERRRANGEISCAECRRQKLKCDKAIPCGTCRRKGCESICPNGTLAPVHVPRLASGDKDLQMHKLTQMSKRVRQLEDALQIAHSSVPGGTTHPLLSDELLKVKNITKILPPVPVQNESDASDEDTIDTVGTLINLGRGTESYFGATEYALGHFDPIHFKLDQRETPLTHQPPATFPFKPLYLPTEEIQTQIEHKLPSYERGSALVEAYLENTSWLAKPVDREQITDELMAQVYRRKSVLHGAADEPHRTHPHTLALLLAIFAVGAAADMTLPPWNEESDLYYHLSWTAIGLESLFNSTNLHTIQTLAVISVYDIFSCRKRSLESSWKIVNFCVLLAASIGLHRDPTNFKLSPKQVQRRRRLLWELQCMDVWKSVGTGRPLSLYPSVIDCELPEDTDATVSKDGIKLPSIWHLRYIYSRDVMMGMVDKCTSVRPLKYSDILMVDQKIREFDLDNFAAKRSSIDRSEGPGAHMMLMLKDASLILLHRNFFVQAIIENPEDPARSRFGPSFLSAYRSAVTILRSMRGVLNRRPQIISRVWPFWAHALSAAVLLGSISACANTSSLAPQAFEEFNDAISMLEKSQIHPLLKDMMPTVLMLRDRAYEVLTQSGFNVSGPHPSLQGLPLSADTTSRLGSFHASGEVAQGSSVSHGFMPGLASEVFSGKQSRPMTSSSSSTASSKPQQSATSGAMFSSRAPQTPSICANSCLAGTNQGGWAGKEIPHDQSAFVSFPCGLVPNYSDLLRVHSGSRGSSQSTTNPGQQSVFHQTQEDQTNVGRTNVPQTSAHMPGHRPGGPDSGDHTRSSSGTGSSSGSGDHSSLHAPSNVGLGAYTTVQGAGNQQAQMQVDSQPALFGHDAFSGRSMDSFSNTDFDISYDLREAAGNAFLSRISDDLAACRTILTDSRFFGYPSSTDTPPPPPQF